MAKGVLRSVFTIASRPNSGVRSRAQLPRGVAVTLYSAASEKSGASLRWIVPALPADPSPYRPTHYPTDRIHDR